jgi:radical SAM superfamily enzyme YgiQ (UPF0313 family)
LPSVTRSEALDKESLALLKKTGCNYLVYAPESGSLNTLNLVKKRIQLDKLIDSALEAKRQGITIRTNLIIGFPHETWKDILKTILLGLKLAVKGVDEVPIFLCSAYPGTEIFKNLLKEGKIVLNDKYFLGLTSLNSSYLSPDIITYNSNISAKKLGIVRMVFILTNYAISYALYPSRIIRTIRNLLSKDKAATVFEHRLQDLFKRKSTEKV